ncbi:hypothetical protein D3C81_1118460 [compost metagenome]
MPGPVSLTTSSMPVLSGRKFTDRPTVPCSVNLMALPSRFIRICRSRIASPRTRTGVANGSPRSNTRPRRSAMGAISEITSSSTRPRSNGWFSSSSFPDSMRARSNASLTSRSKCVPAC